MRQAPIIIPIVTSVAAFVLVLLGLLAGSRPGFMEDYDIVRFNTSELGKNLINETSDATPTSGGCPTSGFLGTICSSATAAAGSVETDIASALAGIEDDLADRLAATLGIQEFYSLHTLDICEGSFTPNATAVNTGQNVTNCTRPLNFNYNLSALINNELAVGPFQLTIDDLGFTQELQSAMDTLHEVMEALAAIFVAAVILTGLSMLGALAALVLISRRERAALLANTLLAAIAALVLVVACILATVGAAKAVSEANQQGADIGLSATVGGKFEGLVWAAAALMIVTLAFWLWMHIAFRRSMRTAAKYDGRRVRDSEDSHMRLHGRRADMRQV